MLRYINYNLKVDSQSFGRLDFERRTQITDDRLVTMKKMIKELKKGFSGSNLRVYIRRKSRIILTRKRGI